ncbi:MAG: YggT family protein [bacterium]
MFLFSNFLHAGAAIIDYILWIYIWIIIIRSLISWVSPDPYNPVVQILYRITEPVLAQVRRRMPDIGGMDFSPLGVILVIIFLQKFLVRSLYDMARSMR